MQTLISLFESSVLKFPNNSFLWQKDNGKYNATTYLEVHKTVISLSAGLIAIGIKPLDTICLLSEGRNEWIISELAIFYCGAISVPLSNKLDADQELSFRINHSQSRYIFASKYQYQKIKQIRHEIPHLEKIFLLDDLEDSNEMSFNTLLKIGNDYLLTNPDCVNDSKQTVTNNSIATISYTSGTTADPKGIILSHRNYTANIEQAFSYIKIPPHYRTLVVLPWDHAFAHTASLYAFMSKGASIASVQTGSTPLETLKNFSTNMIEIQPHVLMSVPALAKNFRKNIEKGIQAKGAFTKNLFTIGLKISYWYNGNGQTKSQNLKWLAYPLTRFFDLLIYKKIRIKFGGNLKFFIGGGALLDAELQQFFFALGIPMYQGYGLTEAAPIISANTPKHHIIGSSGKVVNQLEIKICDLEGNALPFGEKGEIVIRGENTMLGYWRNAEATAQSLRNGWLYTGDLGYLHKNNFLYVLGRFKSLLIGSDGEKYSPEGIEEAMIDHSQWIDQLMLHNNQNPYTTALMVVNKEKCSQFLKQHNHFATPNDAYLAILKSINHDISTFKTGGKFQSLFPQRWLPATIVLLNEGFTEENKLLNSTLKMVRGKIEEFHQKSIEFAYTPPSKDFFNEQNILNLTTYLLRK